MITKQDEQFLRMCKVIWQEKPKPAATAHTVSRDQFEEAMQHALFYEEENNQKAIQIERLQRQRTWCFLGMIAGLVGMVAATSILIAVKIAF